MEENKQKVVCDLLEKHKAQALLLTSSEDIFYFTGLQVSLGVLYIDAHTCTLWVDGRYFTRCQEAENGFVVKLWKGRDLKDCLPLQGERLACDSTKLSLGQYLPLHEEEKRESLHLVPVPSLGQRLRERKTEKELEIIEEVSQITLKGLDFLFSELKEGISEKELATKLEIFWKQNFYAELAFPSIVAFGSHTANPHHEPSSRRLQKGDIVLFDLGAKAKGYCSDMTRTLFFSTSNKELEQVYFAVQSAQQKALDACCSGISCHELDSIAREELTHQGYQEYFTHSLGHGVGIEIHERPVLRAKEETVLQEGMVVTIEPGAYLPGLGGVRIEDTVVVGKKSSRVLTPKSKELCIL